MSAPKAAPARAPTTRGWHHRLAFTFALMWHPTRAQVWRSGLIALALAVSTAMPLAFLAINRAAEARLSRDLTAYGANVLIEPRTDTARPSRLAAAELTAPLERSGVPLAKVSLVLGGLARIGRTPASVVAASPEDLAAEQVGLAAGRWPERQGEAVVGRSGATMIGAALGGSIRVEPQETEAPRPGPTGPAVPVTLTIVGLAADVVGSSPALWITPGDAVVLGPRPPVERVLIRVDARGAELDEAAARMARALPFASVRTVRQVADAERRLMDKVLVLLAAVAAVVVVMTVIGVTSMTSAALLERIPTLGLMRAIGATGLEVALLLTGEIVVLGAIAGLAGYLIAAGMTYAVTGAALGGAVWPGADLAALALAAGPALAALAAFPPSLAATRVSPADALRA